MTSLQLAKLFHVCAAATENVLSFIVALVSVLKVVCAIATPETVQSRCSRKWLAHDVDGLNMTDPTGTRRTLWMTQENAKLVVFGRRRRRS